MIKILLLVLLTLSIAAPVYSSSAKIYVWRSETGVLVYSDTPRPGAEEVKAKNGNVIASSTNIETQVLDIETQKIEEEYQVFINHPKDNSTIRDNTGSVYISGSIKPIFKRGLKIQLILDEKPYLTPQTHTMFSLRNIDRGEHQIKMELLNEKGKVIALSKAITFYMHRASVN
ncbi:DUF4124 domain-containing protein [Candidatus Colwellia aromaticivorans]|uniref:DUF4124 domain-containing protein n=1 Tax=Candidatus Colwellia aromaticivorans TaxID=2267621 RepID=UPI000DF18D45|nr:DUF4124 domain-containing protein [Candidatus Colwellia aromaticivorans]